MSFFQPAPRLQKYVRHGGASSWALVTGASDGIGQGFAQELASHGFNLILHGRNSEKLQRVKEELVKTHPQIEVRTVIADAADITIAQIEEIVASLQDLHLTVLVNNVGGTGVLDANFKTFETHSLNEVDALISVNIRFTALLTRALYPLLKKSSPASIINVGSQGRVGVPYLSVYGATKGFIHSFSRAIAVESHAEQDGIEVIEVLVGSVQTQQNQTAKPTFFVPDARTMAKSAVDKIGGGNTSSATYWPHALQQTGMWLVPTAITDWLVVSFLKPLAGKKERRW